MKTVLTIHGVGFLGGRGSKWQKAITKIISPHFRCESLGYWHYQWLGLVSAVIEPWIASTGIAAVYYWRRETPIPIWIEVVLVLFLSLWGAWIRRYACIQFFIQKLSSDPYKRLNAHVIAHSMGTHLIGAATSQGATPFSAIILTGCVLPTDYPWQQYGDRFDRVRNEVGRKDIVPLLAETLKRIKLLPGFGMSGRCGFKEQEGWVHYVESPSRKCSRCEGGEGAPVHNIFCESGHSGNLTPAHAAFYWLPFLWNMDVIEYGKWLKICLAAAGHFEDEDWDMLGIIEEELLASRWSWTGTKTLGALIGRTVRKHPRKRKSVDIIHVVRTIHLAVRSGLDAHQTPENPCTNEIKCLNPKIAIIHAVDTVLRS